MDQVYLVGLVAEAVIHTEGMLARARPFMGEDHTPAELELTCHELGTNDVNCIAFYDVVLAENPSLVLFSYSSFKIV